RWGQGGFLSSATERKREANSRRHLLWRGSRDMNCIVAPINHARTLVSAHPGWPRPHASPACNWHVRLATGQARWPFTSGMPGWAPDVTDGPCASGASGWLPDAANVQFSGTGLPQSSGWVTGHSWAPGVFTLGVGLMGP